MNEHRELLYAKLALFKMIDQFMYEVTDETGTEYFDDYCESAGEHAFSVLGFEDDRITKEEFYRKYDELSAEICEINGVTPVISTLDYYLKEKKEKEPTVNSYYHTDIMLRIDSEDLRLLGFKEIPNELDIKLAIYDAIESARNTE